MQTKPRDDARGDEVDRHHDRWDRDEHHPNDLGTPPELLFGDDHEHEDADVHGVPDAQCGERVRGELRRSQRPHHALRLWPLQRDRRRAEKRDVQEGKARNRRGDHVEGSPASVLVERADRQPAKRVRTHDGHRVVSHASHDGLRRVGTVKDEKDGRDERSEEAGSEADDGQHHRARLVAQAKRRHRRQRKEDGVAGHRELQRALAAVAICESAPEDVAEYDRRELTRRDHAVPHWHVLV
mmetsp:Transcript_36022/g.90086  ORF Transcript_36022/g.90086 Transcript_36022/m.90086 type:complete len:240 (-) Transcript_36022:252-971(-)